MSYTTPTATEFKARHPRFNAVSDALVTALLSDASRVASAAWAEGDWRDAVMALAAHMALEEGAAPSSTGIKKSKAGDVEVEFDIARVSGDDGATFGSTVYGRRFLAVARRYGINGGAALVV